MSRPLAAAVAFGKNGSRASPRRREALRAKEAARRGRLNGGDVDVSSIPTLHHARRRASSRREVVDVRSAGTQGSVERRGAVIIARARRGGGCSQWYLRGDGDAYALSR